MRDPGPSDVVRVLLVEDNGGDARLAQIALSEMARIKTDVESVTCLGDAITALNAFPHDIVLLDLSLPDSFGIDTLVRLRAETPDVPVIVLTGHDDDDISIAAMEAGAQDYIEKSRLDTSTLTRAIRYARERHRLLAELRQLVIVDELTGVYNRRGFVSLADHHFALTSRTGGTLSLLYIDLDGMKGINDTYGHHEGDHALRTTADLLVRTFRFTDVIGRLGGDEFCVLLTPSGGVTDADIAVARLDAQVAETNRSAVLRYELAMSVGVARYEASAPCSLDELLRKADRAMYERKHGRKQEPNDGLPGDAVPSNRR
jgi:two-component system, cell cycle response regulator